MRQAEFLRWASRFTEPLLLVAADDGRILAYNNSARELLNLGSPGTFDKTLFDFSESDADKIKTSLRLWANSGQMTYGFARLQTLNHGLSRCDGALYCEKTDVDPSLVIVRLKPADAMIGKFLALNRKIEELGRQVHARIQAEDLLKAERALLEKRVAERTVELSDMVSHLESFSYSITHDMRAPLRAINSFSELLAQDYSSKLDDAGREYLRRMASAAERLDRLIIDVLQYSRLARDEMPLARVNLEHLTRDILQQYPDLARHKEQIRFSAHCRSTDVLANVGALTQVISNLITNALKFVNPGEKPQICINCEERDDNIRFSVRDHGIGIAPEHQERIFGVFEKLNNDYDGTGIGLSIVKRAVTRMGGKIGVESQLGSGSLFWVELPRFQDASLRAVTFSPD
jgi:signal transduction histidine kinase